jgi:hypothetical protein
LDIQKIHAVGKDMDMHFYYGRRTADGLVEQDAIFQVLKCLLLRIGAAQKAGLNLTSRFTAMAAW